MYLSLAFCTFPSRDLTINIGTISGGTCRNTVAGFAEATIEMRASNPNVFAKIIQKMESYTLEYSGFDTQCNHNTEDYSSISTNKRESLLRDVSIELVELNRVFPWPRNEKTLQLFESFQEAAQQSGEKVLFRSESRGGLSDGNRFWNLCPTIDGLGPHGGNAHSMGVIGDCVDMSLQEFVDWNSVVPKASLNAICIARALEKLIY